MGLKKVLAATGVVLTSLIGNVETIQAQTVSPSYEVRGYFKVLDAQSNEVRSLISGTNNYTLEAWIENPTFVSQPVINVTWNVHLPPNIELVEAFPLQSQHYGTNDYFYPFEMSERFNYVRPGQSTRSTKLADPRLGRQDQGAGLVGKYAIRALGSESSDQKISFSELTALQSGGIQKPVKMRDYAVRVVSTTESHAYLLFDFNDGDIPANNSGYTDNFGQWQNYMIPGSVPEPIVIGNGKANVLERSVGDASGPWTAVWTNKPTVGNMSASGAFSDTAMKGFDKVFYRVREYTGQ